MVSCTRRRGMGFHLFHSKQRGLSLSDGNIMSAYIQVCNPACLSDNSTRNGGIGYIICLVYLRYSFHCYFFAMQFVISKNSCKLSICRRKNMLSLVSGRIITGRNILFFNQYSDEIFLEYEAYPEQVIQCPADKRFTENRKDSVPELMQMQFHPLPEHCPPRLRLRQGLRPLRIR